MSRSGDAQVSLRRAAKPSLYYAAPVFLAFLAMGFGDATGPFVSLGKQQFVLSNFAAQLIAFTGFVMFGLLSVPMGIFQDRRGKKFVLMLGLSIMLAGVLIPTVFGFSTFPLFLLTVLLLGAGATTLQVAGNPLMRDVSDEGKYSRNLSLAQFVKAIGSFSGPMIPWVAARAFGLSWRVIFPVYSAAIFLTLLANANLRVPSAARGGPGTATFRSCLALLKNGYVAMMVLAIFLYVGAEVCISSGIPVLLKDRFNLDITRNGLLGTMLFFAALTLGRFSGGVVLNWIKPRTFFLITSVVSILGLMGLFVPMEAAVVVSFFLVGLGFANIFPLVFSITIDRMPEHSNTLSGLMVTAIVGAAFLPPAMGLLADTVHSVRLGFLVPLAAILYITWVAVANLKSTPAVHKV
ncbi:MAG TPA: MFS transporter [Terriglobia bacterium]|nr:MFS transporter [Terriglobia bacterium]